MSQMTIDDATAAALSAVKGEVILTDKNGKVIGRFRPEIDQAAMHAKYGHMWTEEDLARADEIEKEFFTGGRKGYTHEEVLAYLRTLDAK